MAENMQFPIPNSVLEPYIKQAISTAITAALGDGAKLVEMAVQQALSQKVNSEGKVDSYSSYNTHQLVEVIARNKIQEITRDVVGQMAEGMRPKIKEAIEKQLKTKHTAIAQVLVDSLISSLTSKWSVNVAIEAPKER
ncbi:hypothetical protein LL962_16670 [Xanthomonas sp. NCPPB 1067]|uniref:hypothetical protein n=1 Tax=Xanthomonas sp. NCPPB 1067 TaxID=487524 RepID=UPI001E431640|nr:hypothetical protein [Xanthomonas sp. NCPPB 1067]MCC4588714.1 hypothetical protein [Xanthomonas sp. NCPPB 1067]